MLTRRALVALLGGWAGLAHGAADFDFDHLKARAQALAQAAYVAPPAQDAALAPIDPARARDLTVKPARAPWSMQSRFVPLPLAPRAGCAPTRLHSIQASGIESFEYRPELFDWAAVGVTAPPAAGFCGFRLLYPPATGGGRVDLARFGGDAWQLAGAGQAFGVAAWVGGDIGSDGQARAAPLREFWLQRPAAGARQLRLYALADAPALAAAVQIDVVPGPVNRAEVRMALYPREGAGELLLAPLTGSFLQGELQPRRLSPLQAERHSVDGLAIHTAAGGWVWRPLDNPRGRSAYSFLVDTPRGFGLLQRDRKPGHYEPGTAHAQQPDLWLTPAGDWGAGQLRLIESAAQADEPPNVVVGFVPRQRPAAGAEIDLAYTLQWSAAGSLPQPGGWVVATRSGAANNGADRRYAVDFAGPALQGLPPGVVPTAVIDVARGGKLRRQQVQANPYAGGWRLLFDFGRETDAPLQLRAYLQHADQPLTETWDYVDPSR
jgi:glucans biosynthesis protein